MTVYKVSERILERVANEYKAFAGIIFDCDGVLIDSSRSYDLTVELCAKAFAASLDLKLGDDGQLYKVLELLRNLGTFNNDWDSVAVIAAYLFKKSNKDAKTSAAAPLTRRLKILESSYVESLSSGSNANQVRFDGLIDFFRSCTTGESREEIIASLIPDREERGSFSKFVSYPAPVGEGLLATFFDEAMYGKTVFKETYGSDCATSIVSDPGNIQNERVLVEAETLLQLQRLCAGNLGMITGRPKVPTTYTMGQLFPLFFRRQEICIFTGENLLDIEEVKPSPRPMLRVADRIQDNLSPILYIGDSEEDLLMVERANEFLRNRVLFAAIAPTRERAQFFEKRGSNVECIVSEINDLPKALLGKRLWAEAA